MHKYPFTKQEGNRDCGVACLSMIIKYYHGLVDIDELIETTKTTKDGTDAYHLIAAAREYGFEASGVRCQLTDLHNDLLPCIAHLKIADAYYHYVVIDEIKQDKLVISDPATKQMIITKQAFLKEFDNIVLLFKPISTITYNFNHYSLLNLIKTFVITYHKEGLLLTLLSIFITIFSIILSFFFEITITSLSLANPISFLIRLSLLFLIMLFLKIIISYLRNQVLIKLSNKMDLDLTINAFSNIILLPYHYYQRRHTGEVVSKLNDLNLVKNVISKIIVTVGIDLIMTLTAFIILAIISLKLTIVAVIIFMLYLVLTWLYTKPINHNIKAIQTKRANNTNYMIEAISGYETIKGLHIETNIIKAFTKKYINYLASAIKLDKMYTNQNLIKDSLSELSNLIIIFMGGVLILNQELTIGGLITYNMLLFYFLEPIRNLMELSTDINMALNALRRIIKLLYVQKPTKAFELDKIKQIRITNLTYAYDDLTNNLTNINLEIKANDHLLITGESGVGKSTLLKLLLKYYDVNRNQIMINQLDINDIDTISLRKQIAYISQNETLFTDTLYNNLVLNREVSNDDFLKMIKLCRIDQFITKLGYNMLIEENGANLSGGEKERLFLGRALLSQKDILILDESLSQMDISLERAILKDLLKLNKTVIFVSHRLDNADLFKQIIQLKTNGNEVRYAN